MVISTDPKAFVVGVGVAATSKGWEKLRSNISTAKIALTVSIRHPKGPLRTERGSVLKFSLVRNVFLQEGAHGPCALNYVGNIVGNADCSSHM